MFQRKHLKEAVGKGGTSTQIFTKKDGEGKPATQDNNFHTRKL